MTAKKQLQVVFFAGFAAFAFLGSGPTRALQNDNSPPRRTQGTQRQCPVSAIAFFSRSTSYGRIPSMSRSALSSGMSSRSNTSMAIPSGVSRRAASSSARVYDARLRLPAMPRTLISLSLGQFKEETAEQPDQFLF